MARRIENLISPQSLLQLAVQIKGSQLAKAQHAEKMKRYVKDYEIVELDLQAKRQKLKDNQVARAKASRDAVQADITSRKTSASQIIAQARQVIKDVKDSTGNNTEYTKEQQADIRQARSMLSAGNIQLAGALTMQKQFENPRLSPEEAANFNQTMYLGLDRQSANINVSPLNQSNQNEIARIDQLVKPDRRAAWAQAQSSGSMATIRGFGATEGNVFNKEEQLNARTTATALMTIGPEVRASGDDKTKALFTQTLMDSIKTIAPKFDVSVIATGLFKGGQGLTTTSTQDGAGSSATQTPSTPRVQEAVKAGRKKPAGFRFKNSPSAGFGGLPNQANPRSRALEPIGPPEPSNQPTNNEALKALLRSRLNR